MCQTEKNGDYLDFFLKTGDVWLKICQYMGTSIWYPSLFLQNKLGGNSVASVTWGIELLGYLSLTQYLYKQLKTRKRPYLSPWVSNGKNKTTLFSSTLKVGENKVVLFFGFRAQEPSYGRFLVFSHLFNYWVKLR